MNATAVFYSLLLWPVFQAAEEPPEARLLRVRRLYIDRFGGGEGAAQIRDMVIASL